MKCTLHIYFSTETTLEKLVLQEFLLEFSLVIFVRGYTYIRGNCAYTFLFMCIYFAHEGPLGFC